MIEINQNNIVKIIYGNRQYIKAYKNHFVVYKIKESGELTPCFAVADDINNYTDRIYIDVYDKATLQWFKLNNINEYEPYGIIEAVDDIDSATYYTGKLIMYNGYEYKRTESEWINVGELEASPYLYVNQANHGWFNFDYFWDNNYRMEIDCRLTPCQDGDTGFMGKSFLLTSPLELCMWGNGFYFDFHTPNSTTSPTVVNRDYNYRNSCNPSISAYADKRLLRFTLRTNPYQYVEVYDIAAETNVYTSTKNSLGTMNYCTSAEYTVSVFHSQHTGGILTNMGFTNIRVYSADNVITNNIVVRDRKDSTNYSVYLEDTITGKTFENVNPDHPCAIEYLGNGTPPVQYDVKVPPADEVEYTTLEQLNLMECPWVGMTAYIGSDKIFYSFENTNTWENTKEKVDITSNYNYKITSGSLTSTTSPTYISHKAAYTIQGTSEVYGYSRPSLTYTSSLPKREVNFNYIKEPEYTLNINSNVAARVQIYSKSGLSEKTEVLTIPTTITLSTGLCKITPWPVVGYTTPEIIEFELTGEKTVEFNYEESGEVDYTFHEYLQGNGTSYMIIDYYPQANSWFEIDVEGRQASSTTSKEGECGVFGCSTKTNSSVSTRRHCWEVLYPGSGSKGNGGIRYDWGNKPNGHNNSSQLILSRGVLKLTPPGYGYINDTQVVKINYASWSSDESVCNCALFAFKQYYTDDGSFFISDGKYAGKVYSLNIYEDDVLVHNYIPATQISTSITGMYDTITGAFSTSEVETQFEIGPLK